MDEEPEWPSLLNVIRRAETPSAVLDLLDRLETFEEEARWRVLLAGLDRLHDLEYPNYESVLLGFCLTQDEFTGYMVHERLARWVYEEFPARRDEVLAYLTRQLGGDDEARKRNALWTALHVGYRSEALEAQLASLLDTSTTADMRLSALWALVWLGFPDQAFLIDRLRTSLHEEPIPQLVFRCVRKLAPVEVLPEMLDKLAALPEPAAGENAGAWAHQCVDVLYPLADIAAEHPLEADRIWDAIAARGNELFPVLSFWGGITEVIDSPNVAPYFLGHLTAKDPTESEGFGAISTNYRPYLKLLSLHLPRQLDGLDGWVDNLEPSQHRVVLEALRLDATVNTNHQEPWRTGLSEVKERSWEVISTLGLTETSEWVVEALDENGPFAAADVCQIAGFLRVEAAIPKLAAWVRREDWDREGGLHIALGLAVLKALGNIGTLDAFSALMESNVSFEGRLSDRDLASTTPRDYGEAVTAAVLTMRDAGPLVCHLESLETTNRRSWIACASALESVAFEAPDLVEPFRERVFALLQDSKHRDSDHFWFLLSAIGFLKPDESTAELLVHIARESGNERERSEAMECLARWHRLAQHEDLLHCLSLEPAGDGRWSIADATQLGYETAFIVGLLYRSDAEPFAPAAAEILRKCGYRVAVQVFHQLDGKITEQTVLEALTDRAIDVNRSHQAETDSIDTLLFVSPDRFVQVMSPEQTAGWHAVARAAVAAGYGNIIGDAGNVRLHAKARAALCVFLEDSDRRIRRAAARSLGRASQNALTEAVEAFHSSLVEHKFRYGIEAAAYLDNEEAFQRIRWHAATHREPAVRRLIDETVRERRQEAMACDYLDRVLKAKPDSLLATWRFAHALKSVGNDESLSRLRDAASDASTAPNKRAFLKELANDVERGWKDAQQKMEKRLRE